MTRPKREKFVPKTPAEKFGYYVVGPVFLGVVLGVAVALLGLVVTAAVR